MTRLAHSQFAVLASLAALIRADGAHTFEIVKKGAECKSPDRWLGPDGDPTHKVATVEECAAACAAAKDCRFFIYGSGGTKAGDCYVEFTKKRTCPEEFEEDEFDFYELKAAWIGCMEPRASNYNSAATIDDNSCTESDTCAHRRGDGTCPNCIAEGQCAAGTNDGYRNRDHDTVWASKVAKGSIKIDGDLSDWMNHMHGDRCYTDVAFARADGEEVIFEAYAGGSWYAAQFSAQFGAQFSERSSYPQVRAGRLLDQMDDGLGRRLLLPGDRRDRRRDARRPPLLRAGAAGGVRGGRAGVEGRRHVDGGNAAGEALVRPLDLAFESDQPRAAGGAGELHDGARRDGARLLRALRAQQRRRLAAARVGGGAAQREFEAHVHRGRVLEARFARLGRRAHVAVGRGADVRLLVPRQRRRRDEHAARVGRLLPARPRPGVERRPEGAAEARPRPARRRRRRARRRRRRGRVLRRLLHRRRPRRRRRRPQVAPRQFRVAVQRPAAPRRLSEARRRRRGGGGGGGMRGASPRPTRTRATR